MKIDGGCYCGEVKFEAEVDPQKSTICHCADCQVMSGSAFRTIIPAPADAFRVTRGEPKKFIKTAESGNKRANYFCGTCGTPVWARAYGDNPGPIGIRAGVVTQSAQLPPKRQIWRSSAHTWLGDIDALPGLDKQS
jgi:hypothetical protein